MKDQTRDLVSKIILFAQSHVSIQLEYGLKPDDEYPTDVITNNQLQDVVQGRAITKDRNRLRLIEQDDFDFDEYDYRIWLYELISHNFQITGGSMENLITSTRSALEQTFMLACLDDDFPEKLSIEDIQSGIYRPAGLKKILNPGMTEILLEEIRMKDLGYLRKGLIEYDRNNIFQRLVQKRAGFMSRPKSPRAIEWEVLRNKSI